MSKDKIAELREIADNSILLDSEFIVSWFTNMGHRQNDADIKLKMAAITCKNFLLLEKTVDELFAFASLQKGPVNTKKYADYIDIKYIQSVKKIDKILDKFLNRKIFKIIDHEPIKDVYNSAGTTATPWDKSMKSKRALETDIALILTSKFLSIPVLTYDIEILGINNKKGSIISELDIPFPFDKEELNNINLDEIMELSTALRHFYQRAFGKLKDDVSTTKKLRNNLKNKNAFIKRQREILTELNTDLLSTKDTIKKWKVLAKPNITETLTWTMVELGLGFIPIPIPTSPINHFIQSAKYKKLENDTE